MSTKVEFAVKMNCNTCVQKVQEKLHANKGISDYKINFETGTVVVDTTLPSTDVMELIASTGLKTALRGFGQSRAAVAIIESDNPNVKGVVRFVQNTQTSCVIDGTIDGLDDKEYKVDIHEAGDISDGVNSVGEVFCMDGQRAELGVVGCGENGRVSFKVSRDRLNLLSVIGRSVVVKELGDAKVAYGIIARSAGVFENLKTVCACDGKNIWNESVDIKTAL